MQVLLQIMQQTAIEVEGNDLVRHFVYAPKYLNPIERGAFLRFIRTVGFESTDYQGMGMFSRGRIGKVEGHDKVEQVDFMDDGLVMYYRTVKR